MGALGLGQHGALGGIGVSRARAYRHVKQFLPFLDAHMRSSQECSTLYLGDLAEGLTSADKQELFRKAIRSELLDCSGDPAATVAATKRMGAVAYGRMAENVVTELEAMAAVVGAVIKHKLAYFVSGQEPHAGKFLGLPHGAGGQIGSMDNNAVKAAVRVRLLAPKQTRGGGMATQCGLG